MTDLTPLMKQYQAIKARHPGAILFFRVGDFYEMFYDDAIEASRILEIALTSRDKSKEGAVPLCGVPYHAASGYIAKLIKAGRTVAICEQLEDPQQARATHGGPVRREVVKVISPGTVIEPELLSSKENHYLAAVCGSEGRYGLAFADLSTGEFRVAQMEEDRDEKAFDRLKEELSRLEPKEILATEGMAGRLSAWLSAQSAPPRLEVSPDQAFAPTLAEPALLEHFKVRTLEGFGCRDLPLAVGSAGALVRYLQEMQRTSLGHLTHLSVHTTKDYLLLDVQAQRHLELTRRMSDGRPEGSLLSVLDRTMTPMGGRLLRQWLLKPLLDPKAIDRRLDAVQEGLEDLEFRMRLRSKLKGIQDLERLIGRIALGAAHPRDFIALKQSLAELPETHKLLSDRSADLLKEIAAHWDGLTDLSNRIHQTLVEDPPAHLRDGGFIRDGYDPTVDELRSIQRDGSGLLLQMEARERARTGIESLKIRYNQVFGYYIEVTKTHLHRVPPDYHRKQTLTQAERFITPELKALEDRILGAGERLKAREAELFEELRLAIARETSRVQAMASSIAHLDVVSALSEVAGALHYGRPRLQEGLEIKILEGRHPVLEARGPDRFIPNDASLSENDRLLIITGPNMAGKSTYMRQVALTVILAQMGSFVPAREAVVGLVDRIFTRVGATDNLVEGQSTFMVEMTETANLLHNATDRSLILLDEIGRGTSTFDGLSIAWAVAEYIHDRLGCRTLFATHYHPLTELALTRPGIKNYNVAVREWNDEIIFLRKIVEGGTDRSYGIQVARLAGLPREVLERAKEVLANLEKSELNELGQPRIAVRSANPSDPTVRGQYNFFAADLHPVIRELRETDINRITPLEALKKLSELKKQAESETT